MRPAPLPPEMIEQARAVPIMSELARRGIRLAGKGTNLSGPCPRCGGTDRFGVNLEKRAFHCRGCDQGGYGTISLVRFLDGITFREAVLVLTGERESITVVPDRVAHNVHDDATARLAACQLWRKRKTIAGTPAERYLREARGYAGPLPATLGYLPPWRNYPHALIAAFGLPQEIEPNMLAAPRSVPAVHLTRLNYDGSGKAAIEHPKITRGCPSGQPIILAPPNDLLGLAICEGIEDSLTVSGATGLGAWAAYSAGNMPKLADVIPSYVETVTIYAHDDGGKPCALELGRKLVARGIEVFIEGIPP